VLTEVRACLCDVTALLTMTLDVQDPRVNRLEDSLLLWRSVVSNKLLERIPIVLFLNKCDLLREKLEAGVQLKKYLVTYGDSPNNYESVTKCARSQISMMRKPPLICNLLDLRNKFCTLHNQYKTNTGRELFGRYDMRSYRD